MKQGWVTRRERARARERERERERERLRERVTGGNVGPVVGDRFVKVRHQVLAPARVDLSQHLTF